MTKRQKSLLWSTLAGLSLWATLTGLNLDSEIPYFEQAVADIHGNVTGDFVETGRLLDRWQVEGGMENSLEALLNIPWSASLVLLEGDRSFGNAIDLIYIGEIGPDYPLMYARDTVVSTTGPFQAFLGHEWSLRGTRLVRNSWEYQYTKLIRILVAGATASMVSILIYLLADIPRQKD